MDSILTPSVCLSRSVFPRSVLRWVALVNPGGLKKRLGVGTENQVNRAWFYLTSMSPSTVFSSIVIGKWRGDVQHANKLIRSAIDGDKRANIATVHGIKSEIFSNTAMFR